MLFLQFMLYSSSFVGTLKNEIPEAALELCQLKIKQFSPDILKFSTMHEDNCFMVPRTCLFIFHVGSRRLGSNNFRKSSYKGIRSVWPVFSHYLSVCYDYIITKKLKLRSSFSQELLKDY